MDGRLFLHLMRALIPRWNFFDVVGHHFEVDSRTTASDSWQRVDFSSRRRLGNLFFNPQTNLTWLQVGVVEQFAVDLQRLAVENAVDQVEELTTYRLMREILRSRVPRAPDGLMQFRIIASSAEGEVEVFVSDWIAE